MAPRCLAWPEIISQCFTSRTQLPPPCGRALRAKRSAERGFATLWSRRTQKEKKRRDLKRFTYPFLILSSFGRIEIQWDIRRYRNKCRSLWSDRKAKVKWRQTERLRAKVRARREWQRPLQISKKTICQAQSDVASLHSALRNEEYRWNLLVNASKSSSKTTISR